MGLVSPESTLLLSRQYHANFDIVGFPSGMSPLMHTCVFLSRLHKSNYNQDKQETDFPVTPLRLIWVHRTIIDRPGQVLIIRLLISVPWWLNSLSKRIPCFLWHVFFCLRGITRSSAVTDAKYFLLCCYAIGLHRHVCHNGHVLKRTEWFLTATRE